MAKTKTHKTQTKTKTNKVLERMKEFIQERTKFVTNVLELISKKEHEKALSLMNESKYKDSQCENLKAYCEYYLNPLKHK